MFRSLLNGAAKRRSKRYDHVISIYLRHVRFQSSKASLKEEGGQSLNERSYDTVDPKYHHSSRPGYARPDLSRLEREQAYDIETVARAWELPAVEDVPAALEICYEDGILRFPSRIKTQTWAMANTLVDSSRESSESLHFRFRVSFNAMNFPKIDAIGKGYNMIDAENAAYMLLVAKLYERGLLQRIYDELQRNKTDETVSDLISSENYPVAEPKPHEDNSEDGGVPGSDMPIIANQNSELDIIDTGNLAFDEVYNACARLGYLPQVDLTPEPNSSPMQYTLSVELPQHKIFVSRSATETDRRSQELLAFLEFREKMQASDLLLESTPASNQSPLASLTLKTADKFLHSIPGIKLQARKRLKESYLMYQVHVNQTVLGEGLSTSKRKSLEVAYLAAAISVANKCPELLKIYFNEFNPIAVDLNTTLNLKSHAQDPLVDVDRSWPIDIDLGATNSLALKNILRVAETARSMITQEELNRYSTPMNTRKRNNVPTLSPRQLRARSQQLLRYYRNYLARPDMKEIRRARDKLPMTRYLRTVFDIISKHPYTIIVGATGSGKTTQIPQIILDGFIKSENGAECNIVCTQPRVMATISVARRVAAERGQELGDQIGYQVRLEDQSTHSGGTISYWTTGVLLRKLLYTPDTIFDKTSHIIIDEVHVRDSLIDFTLAVLKHAIQKRIEQGLTVPRVILMSATMQTSLFAKYLTIDDPIRGSIEAPILEVPGRTFNVVSIYLDEFINNVVDLHGKAALNEICQEQTTQKYLEAEQALGHIQLPSFLTLGGMDLYDEEIMHRDSKQVPLSLVVAAVAHIAHTTENGAILVFLPGIEILSRVRAMLEASKLFGVNFLDEAKFRFYVLHSALVDDQRAVFDPVPEGCRKIILSTDIAESSITIPEIQYVVDTGKHREFFYNPQSGIEALGDTWISTSSSRQRVGRAGRVQDGHYYALFPIARPLAPSPTPELLRLDLSDICLNVKAYGVQGNMSIRDFLATSVTPPEATAIQAAITNLVQLGAFTDGEELTPMGELLTRIPLPPAFGKMVLLGIIYKCLDPMLIFAASSQHRIFFSAPTPTRQIADEKRLQFAKGSYSDHIGTINAFNELRSAMISEGPAAMIALADELYANSNSFALVRGTAEQIQGILENLGIIPSDRPHNRKQYGTDKLNENSGDESLIKALISSCLDVAVRKTPNLYRARSWPDSVVHPTSVNETGSMVKADRALWGARQRLLAYTSLTDATKPEDKVAFLRETTVVSPLAVVLFANTLKKAPGEHGQMLTVNDWIPIRVTGSNGEAVDGTSALPEDANPATQLMQLQSALRRMEADSYALLRARRFFTPSDKKGKERKAEDDIDKITRKTQRGRDKLISRLVRMLERNELVVEMMSLEADVIARKDRYLRYLKMRDEKPKIDEFVAEMKANQIRNEDENKDKHGSKKISWDRVSVDADDNIEEEVQEWETLYQIVSRWRASHEAGTEK